MYSGYVDFQAPIILIGLTVQNMSRGWSPALIINWFISNNWFCFVQFIIYGDF